MFVRIAQVSVDDLILNFRAYISKNDPAHRFVYRHHFEPELSAWSNRRCDDIMNAMNFKFEEEVLIRGRSKRPVLKLVE